MFNYLLPALPIAAISMIALTTHGQRRLISIILAFGYTFHFALSDIIFYLDGVLYYALAVLTAVAMVAAIISINPKTELILHILTLLLLNVICQSVGWILYESYQEPTVYNVAVVVLNAIIVFRLLINTRKDRDFGRDDKGGNRNNRGGYLPSNSLHNVGGMVRRCYHEPMERYSDKV